MKLNRQILIKTLISALMVLTLSHCLFDASEENNDSLANSVAAMESSQIILPMSSAAEISSVSQGVQVSSVANTTSVSSQALLISSVVNTTPVSSQALLVSSVVNTTPVSSQALLVSSVAEVVSVSSQAVLVSSTVSSSSEVPVSSIVTIDVTSITLNLSGSSAEVGDTKQLVSTVEPAEATNKNVIWSTSDETKATVSESGLVTAIAEGQPVITATTEDGSFTAIFTYYLSPATINVTGVTLNKATTTIDIGLTEQLTATVGPVDATNQNVSWSTSDEALATVSADGLVTAVGVGSAVITVTTGDGGFTAACTVTVTQEIIMYAVDVNTGGDLGGRAGVDALCAANKPAGVTETNIHALLAIDANDEIRDMPANYGFSGDAAIKSADGTLLAVSLNKIMFPYYGTYNDPNDPADSTTLWQFSDEELGNGLLMDKLGSATGYAFVGLTDGTLAGAVENTQTCGGLTSNTDMGDGFSAIDIFSGNLYTETGTQSCDPNGMNFMSFAILCLAY